MLSQLQGYAALLLRLPRELRDIIYPDIVYIPDPIPLYYPKPHPIASPAKSHPTIAAEALEAYYQLNTFILDRSQIPHNTSHTTHHIRHVIVQADEFFDFNPWMRTPLDFETTHHACPDRLFWRRLLDFPHLQTVHVKLRKTRDVSFFWLDFGPILYGLRAQRPNITIKFSITFDVILERAWNDPHWQTFADNTTPNSYKPMGYIDVTPLFNPPNSDDRAYVEEYLPDKIMPVRRSVVRGLLDETPEQRRVLGEFYVVKEPALMRVLIEEQYRAYEACEKERQRGANK